VREILWTFTGISVKRDASVLGVEYNAAQTSTTLLYSTTLTLW
jgi:hypothetical protein